MAQKKTRKKPNLKKALSSVDSANDANFGQIDIDLSSLPCLMAPKKEKVTINLDSDILDEARKLAKKSKVSYSHILNDVLRKVFIENKKTG